MQQSKLIRVKLDTYKELKNNGKMGDTFDIVIRKLLEGRRNEET